MVIVGERINTSRKAVRKAVEARDAGFIAREAKAQAAAKATHIDINAGTSVKNEVDDLCWLAETVQSAVDLPLCIDSANPAALRAALAVSRNGTPLINSVNGEKARLEAILPLVVEKRTLLVALATDDKGMPAGREDRIEKAVFLKEEIVKAGLGVGSVYIDPVICPIATAPEQAVAVVETVREIMQTFGGAHTICGLSNVSFGLPKRRHLNRTFLAMLLTAGLDGVIIDPTEPEMMSTLYAARALCGADQYCMDYIAAEREGRL